MPYVNIKKPKLQASVAKIVGKAQGKAVRIAVKNITPLLGSLRREGCKNPNQTNSAIQKINGAKRAISRADRTVSKFKKLPTTLKAPLSALDTALKVIKKIPIPQSVPPGFGLPIFLSTLYADLLHLLKEKKVQIEELVEAIDAVLDTPTTTLSTVNRLLNRADVGLLSCKIQAQLEKEIGDGNIDRDTLRDAGILDENEIYIFSSLLPTLVGNLNLTDVGNLSDNRTLNELAEENQITLIDPSIIDNAELINQALTDNNIDITNLSDQEKANRLQNLIQNQRKQLTGKIGSNEQDLNFDKSRADLNSAIDKLANSNLSQETKNNLRDLLLGIDKLSEEEKRNRQQLGNFIYKAANGRSYILDIQDDPKSSFAAPRRFAIAKELEEEVIVLRGAPSFASDIEILLDEIKFRLDNQLP